MRRGFSKKTKAPQLLVLQKSHKNTSELMVNNEEIPGKIAGEMTRELQAKGNKKQR